MSKNLFGETSMAYNELKKSCGIVIIGGNGSLVSRVCDNLVEQGHESIRIDDLVAGNADDTG